MIISEARLQEIGKWIDGEIVATPGINDVVAMFETIATMKSAVRELLSHSAMYGQYDTDKATRSMLAMGELVGMTPEENWMLMRESESQKEQ